MDRRNFGRTRLAVLAILALLLASAGPALAGTTGKLSGVVTNQKQEPLAGVNVIVIGRPLGAATDADGRFTIVNIPAGKISVKAGLIGHQSVLTENVEINADNTTRLDVVLHEAALELKEIVVTARRPIIDVNRTSNIATVSREQLQQLPVQELQDVVNLQAGVVDGHFRGGRADEVQYQVDGVSVNNLYDNKTSLKLDRSLLEEVQVISGTFDAEYGQAMSGVVNAVLKRGGEKLEWDGEVFSGGPVYGAGDHRIIDSDLRPASQQNFQLSVNGPTRLAGTTFLLSARHYVNDEWIRGVSRFGTTDRIDTVRSVITNQDSIYFIDPTGSGRKLALGYSHEWSGILKLTNRSIKNVELSWQGILNVSDARKSTWVWRLVPDGMTRQHTVSLVQGVDLTHTLSATRFYTLSGRQNYTNYRDMAYEDVWDPRYDAGGQPRGYIEYEAGANIQGVDFTRFRQRTNGLVLKGSFVDQASKERQLKVGAEFQAPDIQFGTPGYVYWGVDTTRTSSVPGVQRRTVYSPKFPDVVDYQPVIGAAFAQEEVEWNDLTLRGGLRFELFDPRADLPSDLANPANSIAGVPKSHPRAATIKTSLAPRLGVSYPISKNASLFFAYGHFYQFPGLGDIYRNSDYNALSDLQATSSIQTLGNPDIKPEKTVQYQFGYKQALSEYTGLDVTAFYKDIRDLLGTTIIDTYNGAQYAQISNGDFGNVIGFTVSVNQHTKGLFSSTLDYTWQSAQGNSSDPNETANRAAAGEDARPRSIPFNWDQRHTVNLTMVLAKPDVFSLSSIVRYASGQPYTPELTAIFSGSLEPNSGRKPSSLVVDLRGDHRLNVLGLPSRVFARVFNLFDTRYNNGDVYADSGDPYYSRFPEKYVAALGDPTRFYGPRRIEAGLSLNVAK